MSTNRTDRLVCITHQLPDFRGCTIRDQHHADLLTHNPHHTDTCTGCIPRHAHLGFVCAPCAERIYEAVSTWNTWSRMLAGVDTAQTRDDTRAAGKPASRLPITALNLDRDEIQSYLTAFTGTIERWVAWPTGAADAVRFARAMHSAARNHPTHETPHRICRTRCPRCEQLTLIWKPPVYYGAPVTVTCRTSNCGFQADQSSFETIAAIEKRATNTHSAAH